MTIGTPLWDDFVKKLKEVKTTVEDMGFMPKYVPNESDYESMSELCNIKKIKATYLDLLVKYGITHPSNAERYEEFLCRIGLEYIYCVNLLTDSFDCKVVGAGWGHRSKLGANWVQF